MKLPYLPLRQVTALHQEEIETAMRQVVESGWYLRGEVTRRFEEAYAAYTGTRYCVGCGNGLDALTLIFRACKELGRLSEGDEVIVAANAYIACMLSISENGLRPVLVEPRADTLEIDDRRIEQALSPRTRALLLVHMYGRSAFTPAIADLCRRHRLLLIEDNAQAAGCRAANNAGQKHTGALGLAAAHSFYPTKNLGALGDAGAVTTDDRELADALRALGNYGSSRKYVFPYRGKNSRIDELQAAALSVKLQYLDAENDRRRQIAAYLYAHIQHPDITLPGLEQWRRADGRDLSCNYHIFPILSPRRDALQAWLQSQGVGTMVHYPIPPHRQECYREWSGLSLPVTERIHREELSIPCNQTMTDADAAFLCEAINRFPTA